MTTALNLDLWLKVLQTIEQKMQRGQFITWFKDTTILGREDATVVIGLPLPMFLNWHLEHYRSMTLEALREVDPTIEHTVYQVDTGLKDDHARTLRLLEHFPEKKPRKLPNKSEVKITEGLTSRMGNSRYTLENFVVGANNRLAHAACSAASADPGGKYNPLFLYGGVGLGKTHLLQATGNAILKAMPNAAILYTTTEDFTNQVIEAIQHSKMEQFRRRYREVDVFIIDDVQFLANKERTQEELFHTYNTLIEDRKQVIISSDRAPKELSGLQDRLVSRFERGMIADLSQPDYETRHAILSEKSKEYGLLLDQKVIDYIAQYATRSVRQLEGILMQAVAQYELEHCVPTVKSIAEIMRKLGDEPATLQEDEVGFQKPAPHAVCFQDVLDEVSRYYSVSVPDMLGQSRVREILVPRQIAMYIGKTHLRMSYVNLGESFSHRDHTTVMHAVRKITSRMVEDPQLMREIRTLEKEVGLAVRN
ncbi:chromosomal replication initiator protein DnaA [Candidatus Peribacteria bacterium]|nr:chromosomal replication initiator protein DnaA [Candidatus Peribacteria bacterium]